MRETHQNCENDEIVNESKPDMFPGCEVPHTLMKLLRSEVFMLEYVDN